MSDVSQWSTTAASNNSTPPDGFPEGQAPSTYNDCAREVMAAIAKWYADLDATLTSGGSGGAYTLTTNSTHAALADQSLLVFKANHANDNGHTLNVDTLGAKTLVGGSIIANQVLVVSYNVTNDEYEIVGPPRSTVETEQATTSGTTFDYTGLPAWITEIVVLFEGVSLDSTDNFLVQIGDSGGLETTGYISTSVTANDGAASAGTNSTTGFVVKRDSAGNLCSGRLILTKSTGNVWISSHSVKIASGKASVGAGDKELSATLDRVRITSTGGNFDAGNVNIKYS